MRFPSDEEILELFQYRCPKCRRPYTTIHELEPRSRGKKAMLMQNRTPICYWCHLEYHRDGASEENIAKWKKYIEIYLTSIGTYEKYRDWGLNG